MTSDLFPEMAWWWERHIGEAGAGVVPDLSDWPALDEVIARYRLEAHDET